MRTWFEPEEAEEFEAAKTVLIRRCLSWAGRHGLPADDLLITAAIDARHQSRDGRLAYWDARQIRRFLLSWIPRNVVAPREILDTAPEILRTYLRYLAATGLRDPRGATEAETDQAITQAAAEFQKALDDPYRQGLAKFWAQTALDHGLNLTDPGTFEDFKNDLDAGRIRYDQGVLDKILEARLTESALDADDERAYVQPPIALPPASDLTEAAARSKIVQRLVTLADWLGKDGRQLTKAGHLPLTAARRLSELLGTGEERLHVRSSAELPHLSLLLAWAKEARLIRVSKGRLLRVAKAAPLLRDPEALWSRAFAVLPHLGGVITTPVATWRPAALLAELFDEILPDILNTLYGMDDMPVTRLAETVWLACQTSFVFDDAEPHLRDLWREQVAHDLESTFAVLSDLGAVELTRGPADELYSSDLDHEDQELPPEAVDRLRTGLAAPDLLLSTLTPLGLRAVRERLLEEGRDAPLIGELATAPPAELLGVLTQHYPPQEAAAELNAWLSHPGQDVETLLEAIRACPFRTRTAAMLSVLTETLPQGPALLRSLRQDPILGPTALTFLMDEGEIDPGTLGERDHLLLGAENFLTLLELGGPEPLIEQLRAMAGKDAYEFAEAVLASGHHDAEGLAEMRDLVAEPLRAGRHRLRLVHSASPGERGRPKGTGKKRRR
ncbi:hypothetical protein ACBJ59_42065 [Nonomuraea sp. MTCD27]|uniref:hypothetical protein n=1 Tax=Nonomuraea sp. MTCD27 TaxID=1676747 RepID=UPI0035C23CAB